MCAASPSDQPGSLRWKALQIVREADPGVKASLALSIDPQSVAVGPSEVIPPPPGLPGRPPYPVLVPAREVPRPPISTLEGRAALIHSIAHIELNAIDLAADVVWRFAGMPDRFYLDWIRIAAEEAKHFSLLRSHLLSLGYDYGSFPAHNSLWEMAERTTGDLLARIGLVPRTLEARGLDASPAVKRRLLGAGDACAGAILDVILEEEIGHVAAGNYWFRWLCERRSVDPDQTYVDLARKYRAPRLIGPFNREARLAAGFTVAELDALDAAAASQG